jgi:hypothetical protein
MDEKDLKLYEYLKASQDNFNKKEEIFKFDEFVGRYMKDEQYNNQGYAELFNYLIEKRLFALKEK